MQRLLIFLLLSIYNLSLVVGDCFDEPPNNKSYENCVSCYQTFANALINTAHNKYQLSRAFLPINSASPVQVKAFWRNVSSEAVIKVSFWISGGFYVFQPLDVFLYRSLFFSPPPYRKSNLTITLPDSCFYETPEADNMTRDEFFVFATQRLLGYAESQEPTPSVDSSYAGMAVRDSNEDGHFRLHDSKNIITAAYGLPFFIVFVILLLVFYGIWRVSLDDTVKQISDSNTLQANIIAVVLLCVLLVLYTTVLDFLSCIVDVAEKDLPSYYSNNRSFLGVTITCLILYLLIFLVGVGWFLKEMWVLIEVWKRIKETTQNIKIAAKKKMGYQVPTEAENQSTDDTVVESGHASSGVASDLAYQQPTASINGAGGSTPSIATNTASGDHSKIDKAKAKLENLALQVRETNRTHRIALSCVLIIGSAVLSFVAHFPSSLMAWATNPFYASRIALFYGIIIFCYFSAFHYTYIVCSSYFSKDGKMELTIRVLLVVPGSLFCSFVAVSGIVFIIAVYVISVPVNNSIETATEGVTSIYNGAIVLIGGLVAYRIGWQYIGYSFSISDAVENAIGDMKTPPFGVNQQEWDKATGEKKLTQIVKVIAENEAVQNLLKTGIQPGQQNGGPLAD